MAKHSRYRWRDFGGISKSQQRLGTLELQGRVPKDRRTSRRSAVVRGAMLGDIRDYEIRQRDGTAKGTLDRRNGRWAWSPTLRLQAGDVVLVRPRRTDSS